MIGGVGFESFVFMILARYNILFKNLVDTV